MKMEQSSPDYPKMGKYTAVDTVTSRDSSPNGLSSTLTWKVKSLAWGSHIHWKVPTIMFGSLAAGIAFAVGHHGVYQFFDGRRASSEIQQTWVLNAGASFAFITKMFLVLATAAAYVQLLWMTLRRKSRTVRDIDNLFAVLEDATCFVDLGLWTRHLPLFVLAVVTWWEDVPSQTELTDR